MADPEMVVRPPDRLDAEVALLPIRVEDPAGIPSADVNGEFPAVVRAHEGIPRPPFRHPPEPALEPWREVVPAVVGHGRGAELDEVEARQEEPPLKVVGLADEGARGVEHFPVHLQFPGHAVEPEAQHLERGLDAVFDVGVFRDGVGGPQEADRVGVVLRGFHIVTHGPAEASFEPAQLHAPRVPFAGTVDGFGVAVQSTLPFQGPPLQGVAHLERCTSDPVVCAAITPNDLPALHGHIAVVGQVLVDHRHREIRERAVAVPRDRIKQP